MRVRYASKARVVSGGEIHGSCRLRLACISARNSSRSSRYDGPHDDARFDHRVHDASIRKHVAERYIRGDAGCMRRRVRSATRRRTRRADIAAVRRSRRARPGSLMYTQSASIPVTTTRCPSVAGERRARQRAGRESDARDDRQAAFENGRRGVEAVEAFDRADQTRVGGSVGSPAATRRTDPMARAGSRARRWRARRRCRDTRAPSRRSSVNRCGSAARVGAVSWLIGGTTRRRRDRGAGVGVRSGTRVRIRSADSRAASRASQPKRSSDGAARSARQWK